MPAVWHGVSLDPFHILYSLPMLRREHSQHSTEPQTQRGDPRAILPPAIFACNCLRHSDNSHDPVLGGAVAAAQASVEARRTALFLRGSVLALRRSRFTENVKQL